jgi:hypothetical protein
VRLSMGRQEGSQCDVREPEPRQDVAGALYTDASSGGRTGVIAGLYEISKRFLLSKGPLVFSGATLGPLETTFGRFAGCAARVLWATGLLFVVPSAAAPDGPRPV